jgi:diguanylate cyclase (GGDEF)-like protein
MTLGAMLVAVYVASFFGLVARPPTGYTTFWDGWLATVVAGLPAAAIVAAVVLRRERRTAWLAITVGVVLNLAGNLVFTFHDQNIDPVPSPAPSDWAYLASDVAFVAGFAMLTQWGVRGHRSVHLDGAIAGLSAGAIAAALWFGPLLSASGSVSEVVVGLAYPLFDLVFVVVIVAGLASHRYRPGWSSTILIAGVGLFAVGDIVYLNQTASNTYVPATWLESTWVVGIALFALAAWSPIRRRNHVTRASHDAGLSVVPAVCALGALVVLVVAPFHPMPGLTPILAGAAVALALARTLLTVRELRQANRGRREARTDDVTALANRRGFVEHIDQLLKSASPDVVVFIMDLDGFKEVNDTLGHQAGDELLIHVAARVGRALSGAGLLARLGGAEFGVCVPKTDDVDPAAIADAMLGAFKHPFKIDGVTIGLGAWVGIAMSHEHDTDRSELLRRADIAMYEAKQRGGDQQTYDPVTDPRSAEKLELLEDLRNAIENGVLILHYQPTLDLRTGRIVGVEALVRWPHPRRGLLYPDSFIPLAEHRGLIPVLTRAVLDLAVSEIGAHNRQHDALRLSVNISAHDLLDEAFPDFVMATSAIRGFPLSLLTLEITETTLIADPVRAATAIHRLRSAGIRISVDDFGVGYSSMAQLLELAVDELKLDRSFVTPAVSDPRACAIVRATIDFARALDLTLVAEGVETADLLALLTDAGCDIAQGYHIARPQVLDELLPLLEISRRTTAGTT